jgi:hypothetical protein
MSKKLTLEYIKESFDKEGYTLLSNEYYNAHQRLDYICPNGHEHSVEWASWCYHDRRCPYCNGNFIHINHVKKSFKDYGYVLLSKDFSKESSRKTTKKLLYTCDLGHKHHTTWSLWNMGYRCPTCKAIKQSLRMTGEGNYQWDGGHSDKLYCDIWRDKEYKNSIKERDRYKCLNPVCRKVSNILDVYHIDYNKLNCIPSNLITICRSCNVLANTDRNWHILWYRAILNNRYGYIYKDLNEK